MMKIINLVSSLIYGDAVGNYTLEINKIFNEKKGVDSEIYSLDLDCKHKNKAKLLKINNFNKKNIDILTYQVATSAPVLKDLFIKTKAKKKIIFYHNITPSKFFTGYDENCVQAQKKARQELKQLKNHVDLAICMSDYSKKELDELGYKKTITIPFIVNFKNYEKIDRELNKKLEEDKDKKIIFIGRMVPHKRHLDLIKSFYFCAKYINKKTKLFLIGGCPFEKYEAELKQTIRDLDLEKKIILTGKVSSEQLNTYLKHADIFFIMSEHEGFCVPLVECMNVGVPILAYASSAIPYTLGSSGVLFDKKDHAKVALLIDTMLTNKKITHQIAKEQKEELVKNNYQFIKGLIIENIFSS